MCQCDSDQPAGRSGTQTVTEKETEGKQLLADFLPTMYSGSRDLFSVRHFDFVLFIYSDEMSVFLLKLINLSEGKCRMFAFLQKIYYLYFHYTYKCIEQNGSIRATIGVRNRDGGKGRRI